VHLLCLHATMGVSQQLVVHCETLAAAAAAVALAAVVLVVAAL
jgi:hypothetical protein